jgi:hypothetical protein
MWIMTKNIFFMTYWTNKCRVAPMVQKKQADLKFYKLVVPMGHLEIFI